MRRRGFSLMEMLVVVAIIVLLLALLFPVLAAVRRSSQASHTQAYMMSLQMAIDSYHTLFEAYPGPVGEAEVIAAGNFSEAQNLVAGLTRKVRTVTTPGFVAVGAGTWIEQDYSTGPERFGRVLTNKLVEPSAGETMAGTAASSGLCGVGLFLDKYTSAMPILYYRGDAGAKVIVGTTPSAGVAAFYLASNNALTSGTMHAADGSPFSQNLTQAGLQQMVTNSAGTAVGAYVLISAGADRLYGPNGGGKCDDIVTGGGR